MRFVLGDSRGVDSRHYAVGVAAEAPQRAGGLPHEALMTNIELYGRQVIPRVRELMEGEPL
jgi:hypothetical protein